MTDQQPAQSERTHEFQPLPFAVFDEFGKSADDRVQDHMIRVWSAALAARQAPVVAQGWRLVPVEATEAMIEAARDVKRRRLLRAVEAAKRGEEPNTLGATMACEEEWRTMLAASPQPPAAQAQTQAAAVIAAASQWWCEREINDWDEAELARAVIAHDGDWPGCPDCYHATCDEPCTPATVAAQLRMVDSRIAQLVHDGKLHAPSDYRPPDGWQPMMAPRSKRNRAAQTQAQGGEG